MALAEPEYKPFSSLVPAIIGAANLMMTLSATVIANALPAMAITLHQSPISLNTTITVYLPPKAKNTGAAVLVFPGGGYNILAYNLEGTEVCEWLNSIGVTGVVLKYRVPARVGTPRSIRKVGAKNASIQRVMRSAMVNAPFASQHARLRR